MQFVGAKDNKPRNSKVSRCRFLGKGIDGDVEKEIYSCSLSFYDTPPQSTLSVAEFEKYALARLKVLRIIERVNLTSAAKFGEDWVKAIRIDVGKPEAGLGEFDILLSMVPGTESENNLILMECRKFDHISHYLLRLAFARTEEQRKWFISLELDLFRLKVITAGTLQLIKLLEAHDFPGKQIEAEVQKSLLPEIKASTFILSPNFDGGIIFQVPFLFAIELVRRRNVFLRDGFAYVPVTELSSVICSAFRSYLSESISMVKKRMYLVEQDQRIVQVIEDFDQRHTGNDYVPKKGNSNTITAAQIPILSQKSFPLCMKSLLDVVTKDHHLKHFGRLQLGLFFKGIGVPLEEATKFWRGHFTRRPEIDGARFDKQYLYNIRHMYGQEGKRADYTPYSCMKVITSSVGAGDHHGCPFKHSDQSSLRIKLTEANISSKGIKEIIDLIEGHHFQIACQKYFEWTHDSMTIDGGVNHPNQYFEESRAVLGGKKTIKAEEKGPKTKRTNIYADGSSSQSQQIKEEIKNEEMEVMEEKSDEQMEIEENEEVDLIMANINF